MSLPVRRGLSACASLSVFAATLPVFAQQPALPATEPPAAAATPESAESAPADVPLEAPGDRTVEAVAPTPPPAEAEPPVPAPRAAPAPSPSPSPSPDPAPAPTAEPASEAPHGAANGLMFSVRAPVGETFVRSFSGPQRALDTTRDARLNGPRGVYDVPFVPSTYYLFNGFRTPSFTAGLGFGFYAFQWEVETACTDPDTGRDMPCLGVPTTEADGHIFQFSPAVMIPYFRTPDEKTEAYLNASFTFTWGPNISPQYDPIDIDGAGIFQAPDIQATAIGFGGSLGIGAQHFLHPNFAIGAESGIYYQHLKITAEATVDGNPVPNVPQQRGWFLGGYAALTVTAVVGH